MTLDPNQIPNVITSVPTVAALGALAFDYSRVRLDGYNTPGDRGQGVLYHDPNSTAAIDNGLVFAAKQGRYLRQINGIIHTSHYGILHDGTSGQAPQMQAFLTAVVQNQTLGIIDTATGASGASATTANGINCDGATLYMTADGTRKQYANMAAAYAATAAGNSPLTVTTSNRALGFYLTGVSREHSIIYNAVLCVNPPGDEHFAAQPPGGAGAGTLKSFRIYGGLDAWNLQIDSYFESVQVYYYLQVPRAYNDTLPWVDGWGINIMGCNHMQTPNVAVYGVQNVPGVTSAPLGGGMRIAGCTNTTYVGGAVNSNLAGFLATSIPYSTTAQNNYGQSGNFYSQNAHLTIIGTHMEGNNYETIALENTSTAYLNPHIRPYNWNANTYAAVRLGSATIGLARNVEIRGAYCVRSVVAADAANGYSLPSGTCIDTNNSTSCTIDECNFIGFGVAVAVRATTTQFSFGTGNTYLNCGATPVTADAGAAYASQVEPYLGVPLVVVPTGTSINLNGNQTPSNTFKVTLNNTAHVLTFSSSSLQAGVMYMIEFVKSIAGAKISNYGAPFVFDGPPPDFANVPVNTPITMQLYSDGTNLLGTYSIKDPARGGRVNYRGAWQANTAYAAFDMVANGGTLYIAPSAFTSGSMFSATNWNK